MKITKAQLFVWAVAGCAILFGSQGWADETGTQARFAAPVRLKAGDAFLGEGRYYPSPVFHDIDGDKRPDIVVGDLFGKVTFASRAADGALAAEKALKGGDGKPLKFSNW